jgi:parvulin-like peptidyl-prolyl isomerase
MLAFQNSDDSSAQNKVGDLGLLYPNQMVNHSMISF